MAKILVVDDSKCARDHCVRFLEAAGHEVRTAEHGAEALALLDAEPADLVVCDLFMPGTDGLETIMELRRRRSTVPILAVSGGSPRMPDQLVVARVLGAAATLPKPFTAGELVLAVATALAGGDI